MSFWERLISWACLLTPVPLIAIGAAVHVLVLGPRPGWLLHVGIQALVFALLIQGFRGWRRGGSRQARGEAGAPAGPLSSRMAWGLLILAVVMDASHLASLGRPYSPMLVQGAFPVFFPPIWGAFAAALGYAALLGPAGAARASRPPGAPEAARPAPGPRTAAAVSALVLVHLALSVLGHDAASARNQIGILLVWGLIYGGSKWTRLAVAALAAAYLPVEGMVGSTRLYARLDALDYLNPISGPAAALDQALREAAWLTSGTWGLGPGNVPRLDFVSPELMRVHGMSYMAALTGRGGLLIFGCLILGLVLGLGWLAVRRGPEARVAALGPAWILVASQQYLSLILFLGWRTVGLSWPPAFIGGAGTGMEILFLGVLILLPPPGRERGDSRPPAGARANDDPAQDDPAPEAPGPDEPDPGGPDSAEPDPGDPDSGDPDRDGAAP